MDEQNKILEKSELVPGVILIKELMQYENENEYNSDSEILGIFLYRIQLTKMNVLNLEIDFSQSKNIKLKNTNNYKKIKVTIMPFETKTIAEILLLNNFKINPKFNFNLFVPEKKVQFKYIQKYEEQKALIYEKILKEISMYPFEYMYLNEINEMLYKLNINFMDTQFLPLDDTLIKNNTKKSELNYIIQWRRPKDFINNSDNGYYEIKIFNRSDSPFINDVKQNLLPTNNLDCVLNALTEKNNLIKRLIRNTNINEYGIYQIKLCIKGEWRTIIIDDYFPCLPMSMPIVSNTFSNDLWVLLIEKALAKSLGSYFNLTKINIIQCLNILTGCPTILHKISDLIHKKNSNNLQSFYDKLNQYLYEKKYLVIAISNNKNEAENNLSIPAEIGYTILDLINKNQNHFIILRINLFDKSIEKNYENYLKKINKKYSNIINEYMENTDGNKDNLLIMTIDDFLMEFKYMAVCYTKNWEEVRIRGKFVNISNDNNNLSNIIVSKCFYKIHLDYETNIVISLFQDDNELIFNKNNSRKNKLDISLTIVKQDANNNEISLIKSLDFECSSSIQLEVNLPPGNYIIFPRTSGCLFGKSKNNNNIQTILYDSNNKNFSDVFINTIKDIFKKFDILLNRFLGYKEFKGFWECVQNNKTLNENYFNINILNKYQSFMNGITEKGFIDFFKDVYLSKNGKEEIYKWLNKLGYDKDLYPLKSRCFMIAFHTESSIKVSVYNTLETKLYSKVERLILSTNGKKIKEKKDIIVLQYKSMNSNVFSVGAVNQGNKAYVVEIRINKKKGLHFNDKRNKIEKMIEPGKCELFFYFYADESVKKEDNIINLELDYYSVE